MLYLLQKIWAKMPWIPNFYVYALNGENTKKLDILAVVFSEKPLPPKEKGRCSNHFPINKEPGIMIGFGVDIAFCDPRFPGICKPLAKDLEVAKELETFKKIPSKVVNFVQKRIDYYQEEWWLWLLPDGSWILAYAEHTALAEKVRPEK